MLTREAKNFAVLISRPLGPDGVGPESYGPWVDSGFSLVNPVIAESVAPRWHTCKFELDLAMLPAGANRWSDWRQHIAYDDRIAVVELSDGETSPESLLGLFAGFVVDVEASVGAASESVIVTAVSAAYRMARDLEHLVYGRYMLDQAGTSVRFYSGLPCEFNAGGRPNRHPDLHQHIAGAFPNGYRGGLPIFTADGAPGAVYWSYADIYDYLMWHYNRNETWTLNDTSMTLADYEQAEGGSSGPARTALVVSTEGMPLWSALASAAARCGWDCWERVDNQGDSQAVPTSQIRLQSRSAGTLVRLKRQPVAADGTRPLLDLEQTNLFSARIASSISSTVTAPVLAGGAQLYEMVIPLGKAWDPDDLAMPDAGIIVPSASGATPALRLHPYWERYCPGGSQFEWYGDAGRLWDANTDGFYTMAPYNLPEVDLALLAEEAEGSWAKMPYRVCTLLSRTSGNANSRRGSILQVSFDSGTTWTEISDYTLAPNRIGVRLTCENLASIVPFTVTAGPVTDNLFAKLVSAPATVKMRLICTVIGPNRNMAITTPDDGEVTRFALAQWFDRGAYGQIRRRCSDVLTNWADEADGAELELLRQKITEALRHGQIEASLPIEWPDEPIALGHRIGGIDPLGWDFGPQYPRVVGRTIFLTPDTWSMTLTLDTDRFAGVLPGGAL